MTYLRYFAPLIKECRNRGIPVNLIVGKNKKYNNPRNHMKVLKALSEAHSCRLTFREDCKFDDDIYICVEGGDIGGIANGKIVSLTALFDFNFLYHKYIDKVDNVIFPSEYMAKTYDCVSEKNLYLGSPKYDCELDEGAIRDKYGLEDRKIVTFFAPNTTEMKTIDIKRICKLIGSTGYDVVMKTRGKFRIPPKDRTKFYFEDLSWYPHTSMELIQVSDMIVNFDSTVIKEAVMLDTPIINFGIRGGKRRLPFLYDHPFCSTINGQFSDDQILSLVERSKDDYSLDFKKVRDKFLFERGGVSKTIMESVL
jgi:hypothetical protein